MHDDLVGSKADAAESLIVLGDELVPLSSVNPRRKAVNEKMNNIHEGDMWGKLFPKEDCSTQDLLSKFQDRFEGDILDRYLDENISAVLKMVYAGKASEMSSQIILSRNFKGVPSSVPFKLMQTDWEQNQTTQVRMTELKDSPFICLQSGFGSLIDALLNKKLFDVKTNAKVISLDPFVY